MGKRRAIEKELTRKNKDENKGTGGERDGRWGGERGDWERGRRASWLAEGGRGRDPGAERQA
eukprot:2430-Rhodomonas_salina.1